MIGIDCGLANAAVVVLGKNGNEPIAEQAFRTKPDGAAGFPVKRFHSLVRDMVEFTLDNSGPVDDLVAIEEPFVGKGARDSLRAYAVFGALVAMLRDDIDILVVPSATLKRFMGVTKKEFLVREVFDVYGYKRDNSDICDAYALAQLARAVSRGEFQL